MQTDPSLAAFQAYIERLREWLTKYPVGPVKGAGFLASIDDVAPDLGALQARFTVADRQEMAHDALLHARGDMARMASAYGITTHELDLLLKHDPVVLQTAQHIEKQLQDDPAAATRLRARNHLDAMMQSIADVVASQGTEPRDRVNAFKALAAVANVDADKTKQPQVGNAVQIYFGTLTPTGARAATVLEAQ
jgi:hypothetical protein